MSDYTRYVVDASIAMKLFVDQKDSEKSRELFNKLTEEPSADLYVPDLFYAECANVLWQYVRRTNYPADEANASLVRLKNLSLEVVDVSALVNEALAIAIAWNISVYDACYVELSQRLKIPLITADQKLIRALEKSHYQIESLSSVWLSWDHGDKQN